MRYVAAYLLLQIGGNASPAAEDIKRVRPTQGDMFHPTLMDRAGSGFRWH